MKLFLAPMHGMTLAYYRNLFVSIFGGIDTYYAPYLATTDIRKTNISIFKDLFPEQNSSSVTLIPQLLSNNGRDFRDYASVITDLGYNEINWNIGCPHHKITRKTKGAGLLAYPDLVKRFLDDVFSDPTFDLSVKMRLGMHSPDEGTEIMTILNDYPIKNIILHARTGVQLYSGHVDLDAFEVLVKISQHEIIYNGDITSSESFKAIQDRLPFMDSFMIGRGALHNPFLPSILKGLQLSRTEMLSKTKIFHDAIYLHFTSIYPIDHRLLSKMKEFWRYISLHIDPSGELLEQIQACITFESYFSLLHQLFVSEEAI